MVRRSFSLLRDLRRNFIHITDQQSVRLRFDKPKYKIKNGKILYFLRGRKKNIRLCWNFCSRLQISATYSRGIMSTKCEKIVALSKEKKSISLLGVLDVRKNHSQWNFCEFMSFKEWNQLKQRTTPSKNRSFQPERNQVKRESQSDNMEVSIVNFKFTVASKISLEGQSFRSVSLNSFCSQWC